MGVHKSIDHYGYLSVCSAPPSLRSWYLYDFSWPAYRALVVISHYHHYPMGMGYCVLISGGRKGTEREIWRRIRSISSTGTHVIPKTELLLQRCQ